MSKKENVLILFDGPHLAFSPTTIQFYDELSKKYEVTIIAQDANNFNGQKLNDRNVLYHKYFNVKSRHFYLLLFKVLTIFNSQAKNFKKNGLNYRDYFFKFLFIKKHIKNIEFKRVICVDITNLFFCSILKIKVDFLSLELCKNEHLLPLIDKSIINCVIIQSIERFNYLFKEEQHEIFYIQNAPDFEEMELKSNRRGLIYAGGAYNVLGFYHCLNYLNKYKDEKLTLQGAFLKADKEKVDLEYSHLLNEKRLIINNKYIDNNDVVEYLSDYEIGFCFYNFDDPFIQKNYFNYASAPSGKMFKYLAAGVPVVGSNIPGFKFVDEFKCGILVDDLSEESIQNAVLAIRENYNFYVENSIKAARFYSFDKSIVPYLKFIDSK